MRSAPRVRRTIHRRHQNVVRPVLLYYPADKSKAIGTAMIVAPGGGFRTLLMSYEGVDVARRLNQMGVDAFVLKYRTTYVAAAGTSTPDPQAGQNVRAMSDADGQQAVRPLCVSTRLNMECCRIASA